MADEKLQGFPKAAVPALIKKLEAEAARATQEARVFAAEANTTEVSARTAERTEKEKLAGNEYHHIYIFDDDVSDSSVERCMKQLTIWDRLAPTCDIEVIFNSPGGSVISGMALFDFLQMLRRRGHKVITGSLGYAASMAGILLQAGDVRWIGKESYVLIHEISTGAIGKIGEIEDVVEFCKKIQHRVISIFASRSNKSAAYFEKHWRRKDWWLSSEECEAIGIVDEVR